MAEPALFRCRSIRGAAGDGPHVLITAGVHGDELEPMAAVRRLVSLLAPESVKGLVTLVPVVNESAYARNARAGDDGLDLARTCPGSPSGSVTQRVAAELSELIRGCDYYVDLHTGGVLFRLCPLSGYMLVDDADVLAAQRRMAAAFGLPVVWGTSAKHDGRSLSVARDARIPAIYGEYGGGGAFEPHVVQGYVDGCLRLLASLGVYHGVPPPAASAAPVVIEDDRDRSGHLQTQHPAPAAGFFEPAVELGSEVDRRQALGRVVGPLGEVLADVPAGEAGLVVMLRAWRRVNAGDALAALACGKRTRGVA